MLKTAIYYYDLNNWHVDVVLFHQRLRPSSAHGVDMWCRWNYLGTFTHPLFIIPRHLKCKTTILPPIIIHYYVAVKPPKRFRISPLHSHSRQAIRVADLLKSCPSLSLYALQYAVCAHRQSIHSPTTTTTKQSINNATHTGECVPHPPTAPY